MFTEVLKSVFLGVIEGITEWLPISSTGHLIVADEFIKLQASKDFMDMFNVVIQLGAILAVVVIYFNKLWPFSFKKEDKFRNEDVSYNVGDHVSHDTFGEGVVIMCDKSLITIAFPHPHGVKKMMKNHKSLTKV